MSTDLRGVLDKFRQPMVVIRRTPGNYDQEGVFQEAEPIRRTIHGVIQPLTGREIQRLPENQRVSGLNTLWTEFSLKLGAGPEENADQIECNGNLFEVEKQEDWSFHGCFSKYLIRKCTQ